MENFIFCAVLPMRTVSMYKRFQRKNIGLTVTHLLSLTPPANLKS